MTTTMCKSEWHTDICPQCGHEDTEKIYAIREIVDEITPTSLYYQVLDAINRIAVIVRDTE